MVQRKQKISIKPGTFGTAGHFVIELGFVTGGGVIAPEVLSVNDLVEKTFTTLASSVSMIFPLRIDSLEIRGDVKYLELRDIVKLEYQGIIRTGGNTMSKAKELLLECKIKLGVKTDYKLAQALEIHTARVSTYMSGKEVPDTYTCVRMALILERDPAEVIAEVKADTEKNAKRRAFWTDFAQRASKAAKLGTLALCFMASLLGSNADHREGAFFKA